MSDEIERFFLNKGCLVEERALEEIARRGGIDYIIKNEKRLNFSTPVFTFSNLPVINEFSIVKEFHLDGYPGRSSSFLDMLHSRYSKLQGMLNERTRTHYFSPVSKLKAGNGQVFASGMVYDFNESKRGYKIVELEDDKTSIKVILPRNFKDAIFKDEVIGISGQFTREGTAIYADMVYRPEVSKPVTRTNGSIKVMIVSDIHVGSKNFLLDSFMNMIDYVNNHGISFVVMNGDLVDGIGIYPSQEGDLEIKDIVGQYRKFASLISNFNKNVRVIILPGNHDIVYPMEPQNPLPKEINALFPPNVTSLSNPVWIEIGERIFLLYHGTSMFDYLESIHGSNLNDSSIFMKEMIRRGHLAPEYGRNLSFIPLKEDYYVIDPVPDVLVTGHIHDHSVSSFNGILMINASTFQQQTSYQKMMNFNPKPAIGTVVDTYDLSTELVKF